MAGISPAFFLNTASALAEDISDLKKLISSNEDVWMSAQDLAFFLATHNFDAMPKNGYVEVHIDETVLKLVPNGDRPELCEIEVRS